MNIGRIGQAHKLTLIRDKRQALTLGMDFHTRQAFHESYPPSKKYFICELPVTEKCVICFVCIFGDRMGIVARIS